MSGAVTVNEPSAYDFTIAGKLRRLGFLGSTVNDDVTDLRVNEPLGSCVTVMSTVPPATIVAVVPLMLTMDELLLVIVNAPLLLEVGGVIVNAPSPYVFVVLLTVNVPNVGTVAPTRNKEDTLPVE